MRLKWLLYVLLLLVVGLSVAACSLVSESQPEPEPAVVQSEGDVADNGSPSGMLIISAETVPEGLAGSFRFTGVPTGTISAKDTLVVADLAPGTYTSTQVDPAPDFDLTAVECDDGDSATPSSGDASTRTAVFNLEEGETVSCVFTNTQRGSLVVSGRTVPDGASGSFRFTGVPSGTISANGTLVVANLTPGTYTSTQVDPAPEFDLTAVECDDGRSAMLSSGDASTRSAIFNLDPGEMVTCTFVNTERGSLAIAGQTLPEGASGTFQFTGVPSGTIPANGTLVVSGLSPGTYSSTQVDPAPDFELTSVDCDDGGSATPSDGDASTRTAVFNLDPGEMATCTFTNEEVGVVVSPTVTAGGDAGGGDTDSDPDPGGTNPFDSPDEELADFPLPEELPPDAGTFAAPKPGPWSVTHFAGDLSCGEFSLAIPASPPEAGILKVRDGGATVIGTGLESDATAPITMRANPDIVGRYTGAFEGEEEGIPVTIDYYWQLVTDEYIVGYLTSSFTSEGVTCRVYRPFEMVYTG